MKEFDLQKQTRNLICIPHVSLDLILGLILWLAAIPGGQHVVERIDVNDGEAKRWGYTVLQGDPKYKYLSAVMQFLPGPDAGTTTAKWVGVYVPQAPTVPPPDIALSVWKVFENVAKTSPLAVY